MMLPHLDSKNARLPTQFKEAESPVLTDEDEAFLHRIANEGLPPELPPRPQTSAPQRLQDLPEAGNTIGNNAQVVLLNDPDDVSSLDNATTTKYADEKSERDAGETVTSNEMPMTAQKSRWSWLRRDSRDHKRKIVATDLMSAAEGLRSPNQMTNHENVVSDAEAVKEEEEMSLVLEQLHLAAVNNRVFSVSKESQELLHKFTLVLKDLVNGVPTAYADLESLLSNNENQLQRSYTHLPPWLQKMIEQLPSKMTKTVGPEMLAAAAERHGLNSKYANMAASGAEKAGLKVRVPSLKDLVQKPGAVAAMLKAILNFLKLRFPAFLGMNVLYSLGLFVLLFVLWYCHKRGREVRLEQDRCLIESEIAALETEAPAGSSRTTGIAQALDADKENPRERLALGPGVYDQPGRQAKGVRLEQPERK